MKSLKDYVVEAKQSISFDDFYYKLKDYAYDNGEYKSEVGNHVIMIKDIFGVDSIKCRTVGRFPEQVDIKWIYALNISGKEIGARKSKGGFEYVSGKSSLADSNLKLFFGEDNLNKIYKFISQ